MKRVAPKRSVVWVVEIDGIHLLDRGTGRGKRLYYPQAAIWDLIRRYNHRDQIIRLLAPIIGGSVSTATNLLDRTIAALVVEGYLEPTRG